MNKTIGRLCFILLSCTIIFGSMFLASEHKEEEKIRTISISTEPITVELPPIETKTVVETKPIVKKKIVKEEHSKKENKKKKIPKEYKSSETVWNNLKNEGFSDHATAGVLGNMMAECGEQTLNLSCDNYSSDGIYYGVCQWSSEYYDEVHGKDLEGQIDFLMKTIEKEFEMFGEAFGYTYEEFMNIKDEQEAALVFAQVYERCYAGTYSVRQENATKAYDYFKES